MRLIITSLLCAASVHAADREFQDVVHAISDQFHTRPMRIPMFGLVNAVAFVVRPAGTKHIDLAVFENLDRFDRSGRDLPTAIRNAVGNSWKPFVQTRSSRSGFEEVALVYLRPQGGDWKLLVATVERREAVVVQLSLNPDALQRWVMSPQESVFDRLRGGNRSASNRRDLEP